MSSARYNDAAPAMLANGWGGALPIPPGEKGPRLKGWQQWCTERMPCPIGFTGGRGLSEWASFGVGLPIGHGIMALDIDVTSDRVVRIVALAREMLGDTPFVRQGKAPKVAMLYRITEPLGAPVRTVAAGDQDDRDVKARDKVECFTGNKQLVVYGQHPDTRRSYQWLGTAEPMTHGPDAAPIVTPQQVDAFLAAVAPILGVVPKKTPRLEKTPAARRERLRDTSARHEAMRDEAARLAAAGWTREAIRAELHTHWLRVHAFEPSRDADAEMESAIASALEKYAPKPAAPAAPHALKLVRASDVIEKPVHWLWEGWLPFGKLVAIDGAPGIGKSTLVTDLIARATRGLPMPGNVAGIGPQTVLIAGAEDGTEDTVKPRLRVAGADLDRVLFVGSQDPHGAFVIPRDVPELEAHARAVGATWLHIDALFGVLGEEVRTNNDPSSRRAIGPLCDMAERLGLLVTFIRHPRKAGALSAVDAGGGSIAFSAKARVVLYAGLDPTDPTEDENERRRVLATGKNNLGRKAKARTFRVVPAASDPAYGSIAWGDATSVTADELASVAIMTREKAPAGDRSPTAVDAAEEWLGDFLEARGSAPVDEVKAAAHEAGHAWRTMQRAAKAIGVSSRRQGFGAEYVWYLPRLDADGLMRATDSACAPRAPRANGIGDGGAHDMHDDAPPIHATDATTLARGALGTQGELLARMNDAA